MSGGALNKYKPMFPPNTGRGRPQTLSLKDIIDAVFYINANGCTWADLPHDFPPPSSVSYRTCLAPLPTPGAVEQRQIW